MALTRWLPALLLLACGGVDPQSAEVDEGPAPTSEPSPAEPAMEPGPSEPAPTEPTPEAEPEAAEPMPALEPEAAEPVPPLEPEAAEPVPPLEPEAAEPVPTVEPEAAEPTPEPEQPPPYLPMATGMRWTYDVTEGGVVTRKVTTVGPLEAVGGSGPSKDVMAFRVTTEKNDGGDETVSWQGRVGDLAVRYREQAFGTSGLELEEYWEPYKLRLDETRSAGSAWQEVYTETKLEVGQPAITAERMDVWTVVALDESVTVPAGTFDCMVVEKTSSSSTKRYWFARGVGKVKETGGQTEELVTHEFE